MLAESVDVSADGKTVTFKLRKGVTCTMKHLRPKTSNSLSWMFSKSSPSGAKLLKEVSSIDTPDDHTAIFNLDNPAPYMLRALSSYESPMVPKHHLKAKTSKPQTSNSPIGTGPFKFVEWKKGQYIV